MNSRKLNELIAAKFGNGKALAKEIDIKYTTLHYQIGTDERLDKMPIGNFMKVAHALGMSAEELFEVLGARND